MTRTTMGAPPLKATFEAWTAGNERGGDARETAIGHAVVRAANALLTPEQLLEVVASRVVIEQAKGMLMMIYNVDDDRAFDLLRWRSQHTNVKLRVFAGQLICEFRSVIDHYRSPTQKAYDYVLLTAHERVPGGPTTAA